MRESEDGPLRGGLTRQELLVGAGVAGGLGLLTLAGCGSSSGSAPTATTATTAGKSVRRGGTLKVSLPGTSADTVDPGKVAPGGGNAAFQSTIYDRLSRYDTNFVVRPELAEKWTANADATEWTYVLRSGVTFTDGSPFTSKDVVAAVERVLDEKTGSQVYGTLSACLKPSGIDPVDDATVVFRLTTPNGQFPLLMCHASLGIVKAGTATAKTPIGCGPFKLDSFVAGESWSVVRNPGYWQDGLPYLDGVECVVVNDSTTVLRAVTSGSTDFGGLIDYGQAAQVKSSAGAKLLESENATFVYAILDPKQAPFDDPKVIEAVKIAVDRQALINSAFAGYGTPTSDILLWPDNAAYPEGLGVREPDVERAKALLTEAGHPDGLDLTLYTAPAYGGMVDFATAFAQVVEPAGIRVKIEQTDPGSYWTKIEFKKPMYVSTLSSKPPLAMIALSYEKDSPLNEPNFYDPEVDRLAGEARQAPDENKANALTAQALQIIADGAGVSVPASLPQLYLAKKNVDGIELQSEDLAHFTRASLS